MGLCFMVLGKMMYFFNLGFFDKEVFDVILGIVYIFFDLDVIVRVYINMMFGENKGQIIVCLEVDVFNGKIVDFIGVKWVVVVVIFVVFIVFVIVVGLGFINVVFYIVVNILVLFVYFQFQVMIGFCSVLLFFVVQLWIQDFQWIMGIIRVGFI